MSVSSPVGPKLVVEEWPIDRLVEYARNPRKNNPHVDRMAGMIKEFGFRIPIVAESDGTVVDGHLRLKAARKLGLPTVPVARADGLSDAQIKAFRLLANKSVSWSEWDNDLLSVELTEFPDDFNLELTGFTPAEVDLIIHGSEPPTDPNQEWEGMPEYDNPNNCHRKVIVNFASEADVHEFFARIGQGHTSETKSIWFPHAPRRDLEGSRYEAAE